MRTITLEEHFMTKDFIRAAGEELGWLTAEMKEALTDIGAGRVAKMDEAGVDVQVLSLAALGVEALPAAEQAAILRSVNDESAAAAKAHPERFKAFATPGLKQPREAVKEVERCVRELGCVGVMLDGTHEGKFLDAPEFFPVLEAIAALDVPLYIHPAPPPTAVKEVYFAGLPGELGHLLSIAGWGWHAETGLHLLRLVVSGVFDRLPKLRVIVGHMGEGVPYALARSSAVLSGAAKLQRSVADTIREQVWVTTSGYFTKPPLVCAQEVLGADRVMFSIDYPFSPMTRGAAYLEALQMGEAEGAAFRGGIAESVLRLG